MALSKVPSVMQQSNLAGCRSSRLQMFFKISVLKNFAMFTGKLLYCRLQEGCFPVYIATFLRTAFSKKYLRF